MLSNFLNDRLLNLASVWNFLAKYFYFESLPNGNKVFFFDTEATNGGAVFQVLECRTATTPKASPLHDSRNFGIARRNASDRDNKRQQHIPYPRPTVPSYPVPIGELLRSRSRRTLVPRPRVPALSRPLSRIEHDR